LHWRGATDEDTGDFLDIVPCGKCCSWMKSGFTADLILAATLFDTNDKLQKLAESARLSKA
jgi:hypothetical protein